MHRCLKFCGPLAAIALVFVASLARAEEEGQGDLDKATELKVEAKSLADLERVAALCESAIKKGLSDENKAFAKQLLTSTLFEHADRLTEAVFDRDPPDPRWPIIRQLALKSLEKAVDYDDEMGDAHLLIARLHALPGGDRDEGHKAAERAVKLAGEDKRKLSQALLMRGTLGDTPESQLADLNQSVKIDPTNADALRTRGALFLARGNHKKAAKDLQAALKLSDNARVRQLLVDALTQLKDYDAALAQADKAIEQQPKKAIGYSLRARIHLLKEDAKAALADLDKAIDAEPRDLTARLLRARVRQSEDMIDKAREDVEKALEIRPGLVQGLLLRAMISAEQDRWDDAIVDMRLLVENDPNELYLLQLALYYVASGRPRHGVKLFDKVLDENPENVAALRGRGDALLSYGKQKQAIEDYESILKLDQKNEGALNNLAWTLATSPDEKIRDGKRALELAVRACEVTDYKAAYILSTLASAHAENGNFEEAVKWSKKAVELSEEGETRDHLKKELASYKMEKPWRELQETEEKPDVPKPSGGDFDL